MNQSFFWFGANGSSEQFKSLWQYVFNYLTVTKGLHNLLFAYMPFYQMDSPTAWQDKYPGDNFVDIIGIDAYDFDASPSSYYTNWKHEAYDSMVATGKPYAFAELGLQHYGTDSTKDLAVNITRLKNNMPRLTYFLTWNEHWAIDFQTNVNVALNDPWVQNRPLPIVYGDADPCGGRCGEQFCRR